MHSSNKVNLFTGYGNVDPKILINFNIASNKINQLISNVKPVKKWVLKSLYNRIDSLFECYFKDFKKTLGLYNKN